MCRTFTGRSLDEMFRNERGMDESYFDELPLLWKNFSQNSFITGYSEDRFYTTFNYLKKGFKSQVS